VVVGSGACTPNIWNSQIAGLGAVGLICKNSAKGTSSTAPPPLSRRMILTRYQGWDGSIACMSKPMGGSIQEIKGKWGGGTISGFMASPNPPISSALGLCFDASGLLDIGHSWVGRCDGSLIRG